MLGSVKHRAGWIWHASGKHPAAKDFLEIGSRDPLLQALAGWVAGGFRQWSSRHSGETACNSWRFWSKGAKKNTLICGVTRDSSDTLGRSFPLTILGTGQLNGWRSNWELLPCALSGIWSEVEYLASRRFADLKQLKDGLGRIKLPSSDWQASANQRARAGTLNADSNYVDWDSQGLASHVRRLLETGESIVDLNNAPEMDAEKLAGHWIWALKAHLKIVPNMVFLGGLPQKSFMIVLNRSLNQDDFVRLWTVASQ
jgi:type VI secretion system protein VasJ